MRQSLLSRLDDLLHELREDPYNVTLYQERARIFLQLGYPDLSIADHYKLLLLLDEVLDDTGEYHEDAFERFQPRSLEEAQKMKVEVKEKMARLLATIGCFRSAFETVNQLEDDTQQQQQRLKDFIQQRLTASNLQMTDIKDMPNTCLVRREVYPWNYHETDRNSSDAVQFLNERLRTVAPKLEVAVTELPGLDESVGATESMTVRQLGLFAKQDLQPGEEVLRELSMLTINGSSDDALCDACSSELDPERAVQCQDCMDTVYCSEECLELAQETYHPVVCDNEDISTIEKDVATSRVVDSLYTQLLFRSLVMAVHQEVHVLDLFEVKYIWGDFVVSSSSSFEDTKRTLPFSFETNILKPLHFLEKLNINPFTCGQGLSETWVWNTLFAKFRGTASARMNPITGKPEVASVHPLWCLANHSCDPNVTWEWSSEIKFNVKADRVEWSNKDGSKTEKKNAPGIKKGEEVFNHYVDVDLPVKDRQEWGVGPLGGSCRCERCTYESS